MRTDRVRRRTDRRGRACGAAAVEMAIVAMVFLLLVLGIAEFGRWLFTLNAASEATRHGARVAVVCDPGTTAVHTRMQAFLPDLAAGQVAVEYWRATGASGADWVQGACAAETCAAVRVRLVGYAIPGLVWFLPTTWAVPEFSTTLMRESLSSALDGSPNPPCQ